RRRQLRDSYSLHSSAIIVGPGFFHDPRGAHASRYSSVAAVGVVHGPTPHLYVRPEIRSWKPPRGPTPPSSSSPSSQRTALGRGTPTAQPSTPTSTRSAPHLRTNMSRQNETRSAS